MSSPSYYDDGDFKLALAIGSPRFTFPFAERGDFISFVVAQTFRQDARYFNPSPEMLQKNFVLGIAYVVNISETRDVGQSILEWDETCASVPVTRREPQSIVYTQQIMASSARGIQEFTGTRDAFAVYEYSINRPLPRKLAPVVRQFDNAFYTVGDWGLFKDGQEILAQDTDSEIYMAKIFVRKSIIIQFQQQVQLT